MANSSFTLWRHAGNFVSLLALDPWLLNSVDTEPAGEAG